MKPFQDDFWAMYRRTFNVLSATLHVHTVHVLYWNIIELIYFFPFILIIIVSDDVHVHVCVCVCYFACSITFF